jgi:outer membrane protein TolC
LAAQTSSTANLLDLKATDSTRQGAEHPFGSHRSDWLADLQQAVLRDAALEERNRSAGAALESYYRLAEAESRSDLLEQSIATLDEALEKARMLRDRGFALGDELESLRRQRMTALGSQIELAATIEQWNLQLQRNLRLGPEGERWRIWPVADWSVVAEAWNVPEAVAVGLARRPELIMIRRVLCQLDRVTAPAVHAVLGQVHPLLGRSSTARVSKWRQMFAWVPGASHAEEEEVAALRRELQELLSDRERAVTLEIQQAALEIPSRLRRIAVAREEIQGWQRRLDELAARSEKGIETFPESTTARLKLLEARGELVRHVMAWYIAQARLAQAQGVLPVACGFGGCPAPCP